MVGRIGVGAATKRRVSRLLQGVIAVVLVLGLVRVNVSVIVNALVALAVTFLPAVLERDYRLPLSPGLTLWITAAVTLHAIGMLGPYHTIWWWDHVTHTLSATIVAAVGYATARAIDVYSDSIHLPPQFMFVYILVFTLAFGVGWEVLEFVARAVADALGHDPVLVQFSLEDTIVDLVFDIVGAVLVALFGASRLTGVVNAVVARWSAD